MKSHFPEIYDLKGIKCSASARSGSTELNTHIYNEQPVLNEIF